MTCDKESQFLLKIPVDSVICNNHAANVLVCRVCAHKCINCETIVCSVCGIENEATQQWLCNGCVTHGDEEAIQLGALTL